LLASREAKRIEACEGIVFEFDDLGALVRQPRLQHAKLFV